MPRTPIELQFADETLASLYDTFHPLTPRDDFNFYLPLVMGAASVLDIGCGTGALLSWARSAGHPGRLCGLDPAGGMLKQARRHAGVEWVLGDTSSVHWNGEFDLAIMTGHAFQQLITDEEIRSTLAEIRSALRDGGRFVFETRNPLARAWERWPEEYTSEIVDSAGVPVRRESALVTPVEGDVVHATATFTSPAWKDKRVSRGSLRFVSADNLAGFLTDAKLTIVDQFGDWDRSALTDASPEIITIARK